MTKCKSTLPSVAFQSISIHRVEDRTNKASGSSEHVKAPSPSKHFAMCCSEEKMMQRRRRYMSYYKIKTQLVLLGPCVCRQNQQDVKYVQPLALIGPVNYRFKYILYSTLSL